MAKNSKLQVFQWNEITRCLREVQLKLECGFLQDKSKKNGICTRLGKAIFLNEN